MSQPCRVRSLPIIVAFFAGLVSACGGDSESTPPADGTAGSGATAGSPTGGANNDGGAGSPASGGVAGDTGTAGTAGQTASGGAAGSAGAAGAGGVAGSAGEAGAGGVAGSAGEAGAGGAPPVPSCNDLIKNQDETDVDCGGFVCARCEEGHSCIEETDCSTGLCSSGTCASSCLEQVAYYKLDETMGRTLHDYSGPNDGSLHGGVSFTSGRVGGGLGFDGTGYAKVKDAANLSPGFGDFAVEAWALIPVGAEKHARLVTHGSHGSPGRDGYALIEWCGWGSMPCGSVGLLLGVDNGGEWIVGTCSSMADGLWHHYAGTVRRDGTMELYVDGARVTDPCGGTAWDAAWGPDGFGDISHLADVEIDPTCELCLGASCQYAGACGPVNEYFVGALDEISYYGRALGEEEVLAHYADGAGSATCSGPSCHDGLKNRDETDVDCGGALCRPCAPASACLTDSDCETGQCEANETCTSSCTSQVAYYRFDELAGTIAEDYRRLHDATFAGSAAWTTGVMGGAVSFDGSGYLRVTNAEALAPKTDDFSIEGWVKIPQGSNKHGRIVAHGSHGSGFDGYSFMQWCAWGSVPCGGIGLLVGVDGVGEWLVGTCSSMADGLWHHYAATVTRTGRIALYVDGSPVENPCHGTTTSGWGPDGPADFSHQGSVDITCPCDLCLGASCQNVGSCNAGAAEPFYGAIDEIAYYKRALTAAEVWGHYADGVGRLVCEGPTCHDGIQNQDEIDVDCGGSCGRCGAGQYCASSADCLTGHCSDNTCDEATTGCYSLHRAHPELPSGVYAIDPDGAGGVDAFSVYCDMVTDGGGWALVGKLGEALPDAQTGVFTADRALTWLTNPSFVTNTELSTFHFARFDAYGRDWTVRIATDVNNDGAAFQFTEYRPAEGMTVLPSTAGSNWLGTNTNTLLVHRASSSSAGNLEQSWLPVPGWDVCCGHNTVAFGYRIASMSSGSCVTAEGHTQLCHSPAGAIMAGEGLPGTYTAAFGHGDGVTHAHGRRAWYFLRDANAGGALCADSVLNGDETDIDCGGSCSTRCSVSAQCVMDSDCATGRCTQGLCVALKGCSAIHASNPNLPSGVYTIDPSGSALEPFAVYCDMSLRNGGWALVGKLGTNVASSLKTSLTADRDVAELLSRGAPPASVFATLDLGRFDGYGREWTFLTAVEGYNDGSAYQYTFYRPADGETLLPSTAGTNWLGTTTHQKLVHLTMSTAAGQANTTWLPVPAWDVCCGQTSVVFGYRQGASTQNCLGSDGQTQLCHAPGGGIVAGDGHSGTWSAAFSVGDGVPHTHGRRALLFLRDDNHGGTP